MSTLPHTPTRMRMQNGHLVRSRAMCRERMGQFFEATLDYTAAMPLLKEAGYPVFECVFNRGYCNR